METMTSFVFQNCISFILLCFFPLLCFCLFFKKPKDSRANLNLPRSPPSLPIIGHLHLLLSFLTHKSLQKLSSKYGPLLHLRVFNIAIILVSSATVVDEIFRAHDVNLSLRDVSFIDESLLSMSFVTAPCGDFWKFMKKLIVMKLLGPQEQVKSRGIRAYELERFYGNMLDKARKKESVEIGKEAMKFMNNILYKMSMRRSFSVESEEAKILKELVTQSSGLMKKMFVAVLLRRQLEKLGISLSKKEIMRVYKRFDELLERFLVEHKEKTDKDQGTDMVDVLLEAYGVVNAGYKITRNNIKASFVDLFLGGTDNSVQTIQWAMAEIINNPKILERLRDELDSVVGKTRLIQESDLPNLSYLQAVVKEGLRLHPPGTLFARFSQEGCRTRGFCVPEKTILMVNAYAVTRDPDFWEDPNEFKPERFLASSRSGKEEEKRREQALKFLPFGGEIRECPGSNLAYVFIGTAIGVMVQGFEWRIEEEAVAGVTLTMAHPPKFTPVSRLDLFSF